MVRDKKREHNRLPRVTPRDTTPKRPRVTADRREDRLLAPPREGLSGPALQTLIDDFLDALAAMETTLPAALAEQGGIDGWAGIVANATNTVRLRLATALERLESGVCR